MSDGDAPPDDGFALRVTDLEARNATLLGELAERARPHAETLLALDRDVFGVVDDPAEIAYLAAEALGRALAVNRAGWGTIHTENETIVIEREWNGPGIRTLAGTLHFRDYGSYVDDLKRGETVIVEDALTDPRTSGSADALVAISARSFVNMPVTESGGLVALLYLNDGEARLWSRDDVTAPRLGRPRRPRRRRRARGAPAARSGRSSR